MAFRHADKSAPFTDPDHGTPKAPRIRGQHETAVSPVADRVGEEEKEPEPVSGPRLPRGVRVAAWAAPGYSSRRIRIRPLNPSLAMMVPLSKKGNTPHGPEKMLKLWFM